MSIESKVFEKLFSADKVELESQKVELASIPDGVKKVLNRMDIYVNGDMKKNVLTAINTEKSKFNKLVKDVEGSLLVTIQEANRTKDANLKNEAEKALSFYTRIIKLKTDYFNNLLKGAQSI
jgi:hypothetical protein